MDCLAQDKTDKCTWNAALGICFPKPSPELLQGIYCPDSLALKVEICGVFSTKEACLGFNKQCAYRSIPFRLLGMKADGGLLGGCQPAGRVQDIQSGAVGKVR